MLTSLPQISWWNLYPRPLRKTFSQRLHLSILSSFCAFMNPVIRSLSLRGVLSLIRAWKQQILVMTVKNRLEKQEYLAIMDSENVICRRFHVGWFEGASRAVKTGSIRYTGHRRRGFFLLSFSWHFTPEVRNSKRILDTWFNNVDKNVTNTWGKQTVSEWGHLP